MLNIKETLEAWNYWYPLVYGYFYRRVNNRIDVEDLTSITITALLLKNDVNSPQSFVWQTAKNQLKKYIHQKNKNPQTIELPEHIFDPKSYLEEENLPIVSLNYSQKLKNLHLCMDNNLQGRQKEILHFALLENKNSTDIGLILNIKPGSIRQIIARSIKKLKEKCREIWIVNSK